MKNAIPDEKKCAFAEVQILLDKHNTYIKASNMDSKSILKYLEANHFDDFFKLILCCFGALEKKDIYLLQESSEGKFTWSLVLECKENLISSNVFFLKQKRKIDSFLRNDDDAPDLNRPIVCKRSS